MPQAKKQFQLTGGHVLAMLVVFFGIIFAVNALLVYQAETSWTGLLPGNGYEASIKYNAEAKKARAMLAKGWKTTLEVTPEKRLAITLNTRDGKPVTGLETKVKLGRPVGYRQDREISLRERKMGVYSTREPLKPGAWRIDAQFFRAGKLVWRVSTEFVVE